MEGAVDLVVLEGVRRGLPVQKYLLDFVMYGFVDEESGRSLGVPRRRRRDGKVVVPEVGESRIEDVKKRTERLDAKFGVGKG
jgi:hypothetical protein